MKRDPLRTAACFIAPNFLGFAVFTAGPVLFSLIASLTDWSLIDGTANFVGLDNYIELLRDQRFWLFLLNTLYLMIGIPIAVFGSLLLAVLLNRRLPGIIAFRTLFYLPAFTSGVAIMILWKALYNPDYGGINTALRAVAGLVGLDDPPMPLWLGSENNLLGLEPERIASSTAFFGIGAKDALIMMSVWIAIGGNNMLLYLAALSNVPPDLVEAAQLDGAGRWATFRNVIWPQLAPTTFFITVMSIIGGLQGGFEQARIMTGGGPSETTTTLSYYIYDLAFQRFQIGYASAVAWVLFAMIFGFTLIYWRSAHQDP